MIRTILIAATAAAALSFTLAAPAHALGPWMVQNGVEMNGLSFNGGTWNGVKANGFRANGFRANGFKANGFRVNGVELTPAAGMTLLAVELPPASH